MQLNMIEAKETLGFKAAEIMASTMIAFFAAVVVSLLYRLNWLSLLGITVGLDGLFLYLFQNQSKNYRKWSKHPTVFPNPMGGGIVGEYMLRPWQNELESMGQPKLGGSNRELKKLDRISKRKSRRKRHLQKLRS